MNNNNSTPTSPPAVEYLATDPCTIYCGWAIAGFICGLIGILLMVPYLILHKYDPHNYQWEDFIGRLLSWIRLVPSVLAILFSMVGSQKIRRHGYRGKQLAHAGILLGAVGLLWSLAYLLQPPPKPPLIICE